MAWEICAAKTEFPRFAKEWDQLNGALYGGHPFFDSRFIGPLLDFFGDGKEYLCIHRTNGVMSGALILQSDGFGRWSSFRPSQAQATAVLLSEAAQIESLFRRLPGFPWTIELYAVDPRYSPDFLRLELVNIASVNAHTIGIHSGLSFTDYWEQRSKNLKANVRRYFNRAEKEFATPELSEITDRAEMSAGVRRFGELETAGWKGAKGTAVSIDNPQGAFYSEVLSRFAPSNQAAIYELRVGEKLAASRLVISNGQMCIILKTTYDESLSRFAPGRVLLYRVIQARLDKSSAEAIEFYTNATRDQAEWATFGCNIQNIQLFRSQSFAIAFSTLKAIRQTLRKENREETTPAALLAVDEVKVYASVEAFADNEFDLDDFSGKVNFESSLDWFDLLQKHVYTNDAGIRYYFAGGDKRPATILPLRLSKKGRVRTVESLSNYYTPLYTPLLTVDSNTLKLRDILAAASRDHGGAHVMRFAPMDIESPIYKALINELRAIDWIPFRFFCFGNWYLKVNENWEEYLKKRSANLRSRIKRMTKKFAAAGGTLEIVTGPDGIEQAIAAFHEVYSASWKFPEPYPEFIPALIHRLASLGRLRLGIARLQGRPISAQLWIVGEANASIYKVAYHESFSQYSPGTVLTSFLLQHVIDQDRVKEVDFLIGDDSYKQEWMSDHRDRWGIVAYNPRTFIGFALLLKEMFGRVAKLMWQQISGLFLRSKPTRTPSR
jgi:Acetyltransferase (GNAT) domain